MCARRLGALHAPGERLWARCARRDRFGACCARREQLGTWSAPRERLGEQFARREFRLHAGCSRKSAQECTFRCVQKSCVVHRRTRAREVDGLQLRRLLIAPDDVARRTSYSTVAFVKNRNVNRCGRGRQARQQSDSDRISLIESYRSKECPAEVCPRRPPQTRLR